MARGLVRQVGWRFVVTGVGGTLLLAAQAGVRPLDARLDGRGRIATLPVAVPVGLGGRLRAGPAAGRVDPAGRRGRAGRSPHERAVARGGRRCRGRAGRARRTASTPLATLAGRGLASVLPGGPQLWKLAGHAAALALLGAAASAVYGRAMRKIEAGTSAEVPVIEADEAARWTGPTVSGGPESLVPWATLGREGRRHALAHVRPQTLAGPAGGNAGPVDRDGDGRAGAGHAGAGLRRAGQRR